MSTKASQITAVPIVSSTVGSGADQRKHQSSASLAFVRGIHRWIPRTKSHLRGKCFHLMTSSWVRFLQPTCIILWETNMTKSQTYKPDTTYMNTMFHNFTKILVVSVVIHHYILVKIELIFCQLSGYFYCRNLQLFDVLWLVAIIWLASKDAY